MNKFCNQQNTDKNIELFVYNESRNTFMTYLLCDLFEKN